jgi:hypothetical protein
MRQARGPGWNSRFGSWVRSYPVSRLIVDLEVIGLAVTRPAVYQWISGRTTPQLRRAHAMVQLSGGSISLDDVYAHRSQIDEESTGPS